MKKLALLSAALLLGSALLPGCACPHRTAETTHEVRIYQKREDGLVWSEEWRDTEKGGGYFCGTDPSMASMHVNHTNQTALGGGSALTMGGLAIVLSSNLPAVLSAGGTATGNIIGAAAKTFVK